MPTQSIPIGMPVTLLANVVYALPAVNVTLYTDAAAPTIATSNSLAFSPTTAVTLVAGAARVSGAFIRATADTLVVVKRD